VGGVTAGRRWTDADFASMSWHDNHVYAFRVDEGEWGSGTLTFDIDYIEEWLKEEKGFRFRIVPVKLVFKDVWALRLSLDYGSVSAGMCPFSIHAITRIEEPRERHTARVWTIDINWPKGQISFEASGFEQLSTGDTVVCEEQRIPAGLRGELRI
jgi:hypothetical protein